MASRLYYNARSSLSKTDEASVELCEDWLSKQSSGDKILSNVKGEAHLVGDRPFGSPVAMAEFLGAWSSQHTTCSSDLARQESYCGACEVYQLSGTEIDSNILPSKLLRFITSRSILRTLLARVLGDSAVIDFDSGALSLDDAFSRLNFFWDASYFNDDDRLGSGKGVFSTYAQVLLNWSAREIAEALAHPVLLSALSGEEFLFALLYDRDSTENHRTPTVADAGWFHLFQPAPDIQPEPRILETLVGWTKPFGSHAPQPEIVHRNCSLQTITRPPRFMGRIAK